MPRRPRTWPALRKGTIARSATLVVGAEVVANVACWVTALGLFAPDPGKRRVLSLACVAWTLGLRHALDVDHMHAFRFNGCAIDNATRNLVSLGQRPVTVGTYFSLGHSTIVIVATVVIAISTSVADHLSGVSSVGGVIGVSVSASFLLVLALVNAFILARTLHQRKRVCFPGRSRLTKRLLMRVILLKIRRRRAEVESGHHHAIEPKEPLPMMGCVSRLVLPLFKMLDRPWKMYPIGVLFGLGFDTSSEIALLAVSALAKYNPDAPGIANSEIIILPFLFAAGMSLVDCLDNVFMLYAYTSAQTFDAVTEEVFHEADSKSTKSSEVVAVDEAPVSPQIVDELSDVPIVELRRSSPTSAIRIDVDAEPSAADAPSKQVVPAPSELERVQAVKMSTISDLSIMLTVVSIVVALFISLVEFMGLAAEKCGSCAEAAENDPGLSGRWWRFWIAINDNSGYLGAGVVGFMVLIAGSWSLHRWHKKRQRRKTAAPVLT